MTTPNAELQIQTFDFSKEVEIAAPIDITFESVLAELGPEGQMPPDGKPFPMTIEARPGGRWYRDLGNDAGHFWGHVQVIKPPTLLELCGPMFVSYPAANHLQYRLTAEGDARTRLRITHRAFGYYQKNFIEGANEGWLFKLKRIGEIAEQIKRGGRRGAQR